MVLVKCAAIVDKISEIVDQEAGLFTRIRFYGHLLMCQNCRRYFEQFKTVKQAAGTVSPDDLPGDFGRVMDFVLNEIEKQDDNKNA